jgi:hypothetical protein
LVLISSNQKEIKLEALIKDRDSLEVKYKQVTYDHVQIIDSIYRSPGFGKDEAMKARAKDLEDSLRSIEMDLSALKESIRRQVEEK